MLAESAPATFCQDNIVMLTYTHNHASGRCVLAIEMKNKIPSLSTTMLPI